MVAQSDRILDRLRAPLPVVDDVLRPRDNAIGLLRLGFALVVVVSHCWPLGRGEPDPLTALSHGQTDAGAMAVAGFFALSGLLVTRSALRCSPGRFAWHRALRILPGFWACLLATTLALGPLLWWVRNGSVAGYGATDPSPLGYLTGNWFTAMRQWGIGDLLTTTPYGHEKGYGVLNGSLWTLRYELFCYLAVGLLAAAGVAGAVRRRPTVVCALAGVVYGMVLLDWLAGDRWGTSTSLLPDLHGVPLLGDLRGRALFGFLLVFGIGAVAAVRPDRFPVSTRLAAVAALVVPATFAAGGWGVAGAPAFAYLTLYAGLRAPRRVAALSPRADLSYGVYIYAFPIQQVLALLHLQRLGLLPFAVLSLAGALAAGWVSWHAVERPALRLKDVAAPALPRTAPRVGPRHAAAGAAAGRPPAVPTSADDQPQPAAGRAVTLPAPRAAAGEHRQVVAPHPGHGLVGHADPGALDVAALAAAAGEPHARLLHHPAAGHVPGQRLALDPADADVVQQVVEQRP